jgi:hypothetical protein
MELAAATPVAEPRPASDLVEILKGVSGNTFVTIDTLTEVSLSGGKANPQRGRVQKRVTGSQVMVFQNKAINGYAAMVERRLQQEGMDPRSFELQPRKWGERVPNLPLIHHVKDGEVRWYLEVIFLKAGKVAYLLDGKPIRKDRIIGLQERPEAEGQGGLPSERQVVIRSYGVDGLQAIKLNRTLHRGPFVVAL